MYFIIILNTNKIIIKIYRKWKFQKKNIFIRKYSMNFP